MADQEAPEPVTIEPVQREDAEAPGDAEISSDQETPEPVTIEPVQGENAPINPMMEQSLQLFHELSVQYLDALAEVWPECNMVKQTRLEYRMACVQGIGSSNKISQTKAIVAYHKAMSPFYERCTKKDDTVFMEEDLHRACAFLAKVGFQDKWTEDLHPETKENVWAYMLGLNQYANMYNLYSKVPRQMLNTIEGMATGIASQIENGDLSMQDINVQTLGQQVASSIDMNELNDFANSMMQDQGSMTQMYSMLGSMMSQVQNHQRT